VFFPVKMILEDTGITKGKVTDVNLKVVSVAPTEPERVIVALYPKGVITINSSPSFKISRPTGEIVKVVVAPAAFSAVTLAIVLEDKNLKLLLFIAFPIFRNLSLE